MPTRTDKPVMPVEAQASSAEATLVKWEDIAGLFPDQPMGSSTLSLTLVDAKVSIPLQLSSALPVAFSFDAGGTFEVAVVNNKIADGNDDVVTFGAVASDHDPLKPAPVLVGSQEVAWLKYLSTGTAKASASGAAGPVAFAGEVGGEVIFGDYRAHPASAKVVDSALADVRAGLRFAVRLGDVQALAPSDALLLRTAGTLSASVTVDWSDIFTTQISSLARLLRSASPIAITTSVGATLTLAVSVNDDFIVAISRVDGSSFKVAVKKAAVRRTAITAGAGIEVSFADPSQVQKILQQTLAGILGTAPDTLQRILDVASLETLSDADREIVADLLGRLGLDQALTTISDIRSKVDELRAAVEDTLSRMAKAKIKAGFAYEYHRLKATTTLFEATVPEAQLGRYHPAVIGGDVGKLLDGAADGDLRLGRYLNQTEVKSTRAWGFTLGFDKWSFFSRSRKEMDTVDIRDDKRRVLRAYVGLGQYSDNTNTWGADLRADMATFLESPTLRDFEYGLHVLMLKPAQKFTANDSIQTLDLAAAWAICPEGFRDWLASRLPPQGTSDVEWSFHVKANHEALHDVVPALAALSRTDLARAFACGMEPFSERPLSPSRRVQLYESLWRTVLSADPSHPMTSTEVRAMANRVLARLDPKQAFLENNAGGLTTYTIAGLVGMDPNILSDADEWLRGLGQWSTGWQRGTPDNALVPSIYKKLANFWLESLYVRTIGALLVEWGRKTNQIKGIERTLNIKWGTTALVVSSNDFSTRD